MHIAIEANIGAGKSTILSRLRTAFPNEDLETRPEPVEAWKDMLEAFYANKNRWAFALQMMVLKEYIGSGAERTGGGRAERTVVVTERCAYSCRYVFGQALFGEGLLTEKEWNLFKGYFDVFATMPDRIVYVRTDPAICLQRVGKRAGNVPGDRGVTLEYLQKLHFQYENLAKYFPGEVRVVDGDRSENDVYKDVEDIVREWIGAKP